MPTISRAARSLVAARPRSLLFAPCRAMHVFDSALKAHHRDAAASSPGYEQYTYLREEVAARLVDRLDDVHENYVFQRAVDIGCGNGHIRRALDGRGVEELLECDSSAAMLALSAADAAGDNPAEFTVRQLHHESELPELEPASADLVITSMCAHWVNDLPGLIRAARRALKPDGLFLAAFLGGETLAEMRSSFVLGDLERRGGVSPHMSPMVSVADAGGLLQAAGFALPAVDTEVIRITYPDAWTLWHHLRAMGDSNATLRRLPTDRTALLSAAAVYREVYGDEEGNIPASFQVVYLCGWAPHDSQQRPLARGTATVSLKELGDSLGLDKQPFPPPPGQPPP